MVLIASRVGDADQLHQLQRLYASSFGGGMVMPDHAFRNLFASTGISGFKDVMDLEDHHPFSLIAAFLFSSAEFLW